MVDKGVLVIDPNTFGQVRSRTIEKALEYRFLADLTAELLRRDILFDVMRSDVDEHGYDLVIEANGVTRHIQLKGRAVEGTAKRVTCNVALCQRGSGCIVLLDHKDRSQQIHKIRFFGSVPNQKMTDISTFKTAKHQKGNATGIKNERPNQKIIPRDKFDILSGFDELAVRLFG